MYGNEQFYNAEAFYSYIEEAQTTVATVEISTIDIGPPYPYVPSEHEVPIDRAVLVCLGNTVKQIKESEIDSDISFWESASLNREGFGNEYTLRSVMVFYSSEGDTSLTVQASGDGGVTWEESATLSIESTGKEIRRTAVGMNVSGGDLRIRIFFPSDYIVNVYKIRLGVVRRSTMVLKA